MLHVTPTSREDPVCLYAEEIQQDRKHLLYWNIDVAVVLHAVLMVVSLIGLHIAREMGIVNNEHLIQKKHLVCPFSFNLVLYSHSKAIYLIERLKTIIFIRMCHYYFYYFTFWPSISWLKQKKKNKIKKKCYVHATTGSHV